MTLRKEAFENILGEGENASNQHFLLYPKYFLPFPQKISNFESHLFCRLQCNAFEFVYQSRILLFGKELTLYLIANFWLLQFSNK